MLNEPDENDDDIVVPLPFDPSRILSRAEEGAGPVADESDDSWESATADPSVTEEQRLAKRPDISWFPDAVDWGDPDDVLGIQLIPKCGGYLVVEKLSLLRPGKPWFETRVYKLLADAAPDGTVQLWDPILRRHLVSNWKQMLAEDFTLKLPPKGTNPETVLESDGKRRRRKKLVQKALKSDGIEEGDGQPSKGGKGRRGRPKGSKNRSKEVVAAERSEKRALTAKKKTARVKKNGR